MDIDVWLTVPADELLALLARASSGEPVRVCFRHSDGTPIAALLLADLEYLTHRTAPRLALAVP
jgi:hypothetical protein